MSPELIEIEACPEYNADISHFILIPSLYSVIQLQGFFVIDLRSFSLKYQTSLTFDQTYEVLVVHKTNRTNAVFAISIKVGPVEPT